MCKSISTFKHRIVINILIIQVERLVVFFFTALSCLCPRPSQALDFLFFFSSILYWLIEKKKADDQCLEVIVCILYLANESQPYTSSKIIWNPDKLLNGSSRLRPLPSIAGSEPYRMSDSSCPRQRARSALSTLSESLFEDAPTHPAVRPTCMPSPQ